MQCMRMAREKIAELASLPFSFVFSYLIGTVLVEGVLQA